jgi:ankyrin repeat protein/energy-coupling factor transporter ATP-binding protein EcfA2
MADSSKCKISDEIALYLKSVTNKELRTYTDDIGERLVIRSNVNDWNLKYPNVFESLQTVFSERTWINDTLMILWDDLQESSLMDLRSEIETYTPEANTAPLENDTFMRCEDEKYESTANNVDTVSRDIHESILVGYQRARASMTKNCTLVIGNTGAGKSTLINYLIGCKMVEQSKHAIVAKDSRIKETAKIGHTRLAETSYPQLVRSQEGIMYCDCPGFEENRILDKEVSQQLTIYRRINIQFVVEFSSSIQGLIVVIEYGSFEVSRGSGFRKLLKTLTQLIHNITDTLESIVFVISKTPHTATVPKIRLLISKFQDILMNEYSQAEDKETQLHIFEQMTLLEHLGRPNSNVIIGNIFDHKETEKSTRSQIVDQLYTTSYIPKSQFYVDLSIKQCFDTFVLSIIRDASLLFRNLDKTQGQHVQIFEKLENQIKQRDQTVGNLADVNDPEHKIDVNSDDEIARALEEIKINKERIEVCHSQILNTRDIKMEISGQIEEMKNSREIVSISELRVVERPWYDFYGSTAEKFEYMGDPLISITKIEKLVSIDTIRRIGAGLVGKTVGGYMGTGMGLGVGLGALDAIGCGTAALGGKVAVAGVVGLVTPAMLTISVLALAVAGAVGGAYVVGEAVCNRIDKREPLVGDESEHHGEFSPIGGSFNEQQTQFQIVYRPYLRRKAEVSILYQILKSSTQATRALIQSKNYDLQKHDDDIKLAENRITELERENREFEEKISQWRGATLDLRKKKICELELEITKLNRSIPESRSTLAEIQVQLSRDETAIHNKAQYFDMIVTIVAIQDGFKNFDVLREPVITEFSKRYQNFISKSQINQPISTMQPTWITTEIRLPYDAIEKGALYLIKDFVELGSNPNWGSLTYLGYPLIHYAIKWRKLTIVEYLLSKKAFKDAEDDHGCTPLYLACQEGWTEIIPVLFRYKVNINRPKSKSRLSHDSKSQDTDSHLGNTPLHISMLNEHVQIVDILVENKADPSIANINGNTCLHIAVIMRNFELVEKLMSVIGIQCFSHNKDGNTPLHLAVDLDNLKILKLLVGLLQPKRWSLKKIDSIVLSKTLNYQDSRGDTFLHKAVRQNKVELVRWISETRIFALDTPNRDGDTVLHIAVNDGHVDMVELFLESKAPMVYLKNTQGSTIFTIIDRRLQSGSESDKHRYAIVKKLLNRLKRQHFLKAALDQSITRKISSETMDKIFDSNLSSFIDEHDILYLLECSQGLKSSIKKVLRDNATCQRDTLVPIIIEMLENWTKELSINDNISDDGLVTLESNIAYQEQKKSFLEEEFEEELITSLNAYCSMSRQLLEKEVLRKPTGGDKFAESLDSVASRMLPVGIAGGALVGNISIATNPVQMIGEQLGMSTKTVWQGLGITVGLGMESLLKGISRIIQNMEDNKAANRATNVIQALETVNRKRPNRRKIDQIAEQMMLRYRDQINELQGETDVGILANYIAQKIIDHIVGDRDRYINESHSWIGQGFKVIDRKRKMLSGTFRQDLELDIIDRCVLAIKYELHKEEEKDDSLLKLATKTPRPESWSAPKLLARTYPKIRYENGRYKYYIDNKPDAERDYLNYGFYYAKSLENNVDKYTWRLDIRDIFHSN